MYSIKSLSKITGIPPNTLRSWERRYGIPAARRDEQGFRRYSTDDVAYISLIGRLVSQGHAIGRLATMTGAELKALDTSAFTTTADDGRDVLKKRIVEAIATLNVPAYRSVLTQALVCCAPADACAHVVAPALQEIGQRWAEGRLDVAAEHAFSSITKQLLFASVNMMQWTATRQHLAFATLPGERHELGALMAYFIAASRGFQCTYFGPDVPLRSFAEALRICQARVLVLSIVAPQNMNDVSREVSALAATLRPDIEIWIGTAHRLDFRDLKVPVFSSFETFDEHLIAFG